MQIQMSSDLLIAVSGGADSRALLLLLCALWKRHNALDRLVVVTVDHGLRKESAQEVLEVHAFARTLGVQRVYIERVKVAPRGNQEAAARAARWNAIAHVMQRCAIDVVATAHHADDLFESFLFQLARKRGAEALDTLPSRASIPIPNPKQRALIRPLRAVRKRDLIALLTRCGVAWSEDPTNHSPDQFRAQIRQFLLLGGETLDPCVDGLAALATTRSALPGATKSTPTNSRAELCALQPNLRRTTLARMLKHAGCVAPQSRTLDQLSRAVGDAIVRPRVYRFRGVTMKLTRTSLRAEAVA